MDLQSFDKGKRKAPQTFLRWSALKEKVNGASGEPLKGSLLLKLFYHIELMKTIAFFTMFAIYATLSMDGMNWSMWLRGLACGVMLCCWVIYGTLRWHHE